MNLIFKMTRTIVLIVTTSIISSLLTIGTTAIVVDHYIQSALQQFQVPIKKEPLTALSLWGALWNGHAQTNGTMSADEQSPVIPPEEDDALPVWGSVSEEADEVASQDEIVISPDALSDQKDQLPAEEKDEIFRTLLQKLPQEEWQRISTLMEDGLTSAELTEVQQLLAKHLNDEEYMSMLTILSNQSKKENEAGAPLSEESSSEAEVESPPVEQETDGQQIDQLDH